MLFVIENVPGTKMIAKRIRVYGLVQGVGFRWSTCREARRLGLFGWVRNRSDGSVEIHAQGSEDALAQLENWAANGPPLARVDHLEMLPAPVENLDGFAEYPTS